MRSRAPISLLLAGLTAVALAASTELPSERGAAGTWHRLLKLKTIASVMHTTAHPDDEHGGVLAWLSRGVGARVSLLTLNRGEAGDNAIGPELFDGLGLIRTEELLVAGKYYGLDAQYFTTVADYGFSKRLEEALTMWGRENLLREMVAIIRRDRPFVIVSRFQGSDRDGHGQHQAAGVMTREAFEAAGDPSRFPEQIAEGLRPWQPLKLYMGGVRDNEARNVRVDAGQYSATLGESFQTFARLGLAFQRSQNGGRVASAPGPAYFNYRRLASRVKTPEREQTFFDGIDVTLTGMFDALRSPAPESAPGLLGLIQREIDEALATFDPTDPARSVPALARGLQSTREAMDELQAHPDVKFLLEIKERQFSDAINAALGVDFTATAAPFEPEESPEVASPIAFGAPQAMAPVVPGQSLLVKTTFVSRGSVQPYGEETRLRLPEGWVSSGRGVISGQVVDPQRIPGLVTGDASTAVRTQTFTLTIPREAEVSRPYFRRASIAESRYSTTDPPNLYRPAAAPVATARTRYLVEGVPVDVEAVVRRWESRVPYGYESREIMVLPAIGVTLSPRHAVVPSGRTRTIEVQMRLAHNRDEATAGQARLVVPSGWTVSPAVRPFNFGRAGERQVVQWRVSIPAMDARDYRIEAVVTANGREYREGYDTIEHRDLETRYQFRDAVSLVRGIDVKIAPGLRVGYVMGIGDEVPAAIAQLGAAVQLLDEEDLGRLNLGRFDAIVTGTRAYAVRQDLRTHRQRLLDYVRQGGHLVVLYNTQELVPDQLAPYPGELTAQAEEVSEEDAAVELLAPQHPLLTIPNRITSADFDGWIEQRGSKFWSRWDDRYTALLSSNDTGQAPQRGGALTARFGKGRYTYFAYALHRQLPYGVPGAYRLLANLLSAGKSSVNPVGNRADQ